MVATAHNRDSMSPLIRLQLLGEPQIVRADGSPLPLSRKDAALLAVLALDGPQSRDRLAALVWPHSPPAAALTSLRQRAHRLRQAGAGEAIRLGEPVQWAAGWQCDACQDAAQDEAGQRLLGSFEYDAEEALARWVAEQREARARRQVDALSGEAAACEARGQLHAALALVERVLALQPLREHAWRHRIRLHYLRGDRAAAIAAFEQFEALLRDELGARPHRETVELLRLVETSDQPPRPQAMPTWPALSRPPQRIGRESQWRHLEMAAADGQVMLVLGPAGMGKTRLMQDFLAGREGVEWLAARSGDEGAPYALAIQLLSPPQRRLGALAPAVRRELSRLLPQLGTAPATPGAQGPLWRAIEAALEQAVADGLQWLAIDDLHHADAASRDLLRWLCGSAALGSLRWIVSARPDETPDMRRFLDEWQAASHRPVAVTLQPWAPAEVERLLASLTLPEGIAVPDAARLHAHAGGQPYFTLQSLKVWLASGAGRWPVPESVQALLGRQLDRLDERATELLHLCAVFGAVPPLPMVADVLGCSAMALAPPLQALERADVLRGASFSHDLMRDAALGRVPHALASELHAQSARWLEVHEPNAAAQQAGHWTQAGQPLRAALAWHRAGLAARLAGRLAEQEDLLRRSADAARSAGRPDLAFDALHAALDSILIRFGGQAELEAALALAPLACDGRQQLLAQMSQVDALLNLGRFADALQAADALETLAQAQPALHADALCLLGMALAHNGRIEQALAILQKAQAAAGAAGATALHVASAQAFSFTAAGRQRPAIEAQRRALALAVELGDTAEAALAEGNLATTLAVAGDQPASLEHAREAVRLHREMGSQGGIHAAIAQVNRAVAAAWCGYPDEADAALLAAQPGVEDSGSVAAQAKLHTAAAIVAALREDWLGCLRRLELMPANAPPAMAVQAALLRCRADAALRRDVAPSHAGLDALLQAHPQLSEQAAVLVCLAARDRGAAGRQRLRAAIERYRVAGLPQLANSLRLQQLAGQSRVSARSLDEARSLLDGIDLGLVATLSRAEAGEIVARVLERGGDPAEAARARAAVRVALPVGAVTPQ